MSVGRTLSQMERCNDARWRHHWRTAPTKLRWRALAARHSFHILPGESILELGAGGGDWAFHLIEVTRRENPFTGIVFNQDLLARARRAALPGAAFVSPQEALEGLPEHSFDYVVGNGVLGNGRSQEALALVRRFLRPSGRFLSFEQNRWSLSGSWRHEFSKLLAREGYREVSVAPFDMVHPATPAPALRLAQNLGILLENMPAIRRLCRTLLVHGRAPGSGNGHRTQSSLARHPGLAGAVSVVVPCHNEEMNVQPLIEALLQFYGEYIHEIIIVNDNSTDRTADAVCKVAAAEPRVKLINRDRPPGVGRALRAGYSAASGRYILSMDSDFVTILPEFRDLFDAVAEGNDGAIGSRFSHDSLLVNYPFFKILCNRAFHTLVKLFVLPCVRDVTNNLKLYRAEIFKNMELAEPHFAANAETGLKPLLSGYRIREVPISWINRSEGMGDSSFKLLKVAPHYLLTFFRALRCLRQRERKPLGSCTAL